MGKCRGGNSVFDLDCYFYSVTGVVAAVGLWYTSFAFSQIVWTNSSRVLQGFNEELGFPIAVVLAFVSPETA